MAVTQSANPILERMQKALALQKAGEVEKAQRLYKQVLKKAPNNPDANHLLGVCYRQLGHPKRALQYIQKAISLANDRAPFYANLARAMSDIPNSDTESVLALTQQALNMDPTLIEAQNLQAVCLSKLDMKLEAEAMFQQLIVQNPNYMEAYRNYGMLLRDNKDFDKAVAFFNKCVQLDPDNASHYVERARARLEANQLDASHQELTEALERFPRNGILHHEFSRLCFKQGNSADGEASARFALELAPDDHHRMVTLGVILHGIGEYSQAIQLFKRAMVKSKAPLPAAEWNMALSHLGNGDLTEGWAHYHARFFEGHTSVLLRKFDKPVWDGSPIGDKTLLVWADQGVGDALRCGTLIPEVFDKAGKVIIETSQKLVPIFEASFPEAVVRIATFEGGTMNPTADDYDFQISMSDLAPRLRPTIASFKRAKHPVYKVPDDLVQQYYGRIPDADKKPVVGVSWRSRNLAAHRAKSYLSAPDFSPIVEVEDVIFLNLQYQALEKEVRFMQEAKKANFIHFDEVDQFNDLVGAAALARCCDLIISANTSVAEMAGCQNIPCWTFGEPASHFLLGQEIPPWYDNMTYSVIHPGHYVSEIVPELVERLESWKTSWKPDERLKRIGL